MLALLWNISRLPAGAEVTNDVFSDSHQENDKTKYILYYTPFWNHRDYKIGFGREPFQTKCSLPKNCFATNDRQYLQSMGDFDAVIFHPMDFHIDLEISSIRHWRRPHQRFVYFNAESPQTYPLSSESPPGFYNWTMTYRHDSDVVCPYGWFEEKNHGSMYPPTMHRTEWPVVYNEQEFTQQDFSAWMHLARRPKKVAWIVSNCNAASRRDDYVRELSKHIPVDVFGKCGAHSCHVGYQVGQNKIDNCTLVVKKNYKFYLSFENSLCKAYVTEKFFSRVSESLAIVMGGANYSQVAPPHSYVNVMDYDSPRDLARYLDELDRNDSLYLSYFWWKQHYTVRIGSQHSFCHLCDKLHSPTEPTKSYANLRDWWNSSAQCEQARVPGMLVSPSLRVDWKNGK